MVPRYLVNFDLAEIEKYYCDFLVIGGGIAGLFAALKAAPHGEVVVVTKGSLEECNTTYAQGGIAAVVAGNDSALLHQEDTLEAGAGICHREAVKALVEEGPRRVQELIDWGVPFDLAGEGFSLGREGAHSRDRILHVGDYTGKVIQEVLMARAREHQNIQIVENLFVLDLLTEGATCLGVLACPGEGTGYQAFLSPVVILAAGGIGQVFERTTNSEVVTGDGVAMAYRAGAQVMDLEFVQFHPTVFYSPGGRAFLISEAVRGAGGILRNEEEEQFMARYHPLADLGPRDVVIRAMISVLKKTGTNFIYLDLRHLGRDFLKSRFPNIYHTLGEYNLDVTEDLIPVVPAAHYAMGGVKTNLYGETALRGLYAAGEVACTGVHGANRLASNSLLEGVVFGERVVRRALEGNGNPSRDLKRVNVCYQGARTGTCSHPPGDVRGGLRKVMFDKAGIIRHRESLDHAWEYIQEHRGLLGQAMADRQGFELQNMLLVSALLVRAARLRQESRGGHYRQDLPLSVDQWRGHLVFSLKGDRKEEEAWSGINW